MTLRLQPLPASREALVDVLLTVKERTQTKSGCLRCSVYSACGGEDTILYVELWRSKLDMVRHIQSDLFRQILIAMELGRESPEVTIYEVSETEGMELIKNVRSSPDVDNANA